MIRRVIIIALLTAACASESPLPTPPGGDETFTLADYTIRPRVGSSTTLRYYSRDVSPNGDTSTVTLSDYRYTVVDTAFALRPGVTCLAVRRETITNGTVASMDTTYHWAGPLELITYERPTDTVGRRRLKRPLEPGTRFILRDNLGPVENNTYVIVSMRDTVVTPVTTFANCAHVRMRTSTTDAQGTSVFADEVWLAPFHGIVRQVQTRTYTPAGSTAPVTTTILEFLLTARSI